MQVFAYWHICRLENDMKFEIICNNRNTAETVMKKFAKEGISSKITQKYGMNPCGNGYDGNIEEYFILEASYGFEGYQREDIKVFFEESNKVEEEFNEIFKKILENNREIKLSGEYIAIPEIYGVAFVSN